MRGTRCASEAVTTRDGIIEGRREVMYRKLLGLPEDHTLGFGQGTSLPLITVVITNLLNNNTVTIRLQDFLNDLMLQVCANLIATGVFTCTVTR
jgi:phosphoserine aminotransferase